ncbi:InlB B-repeat-containing protein [Candidatus Methanarcanum hacksteinii]|uniref:InlB B-repeat-containing protein n=1 Tax=Candidatus Methanarcanum hacksteinii TaxID=2911857 RepID=UPI0037DD6BDE
MSSKALTIIALLAIIGISTGAIVAILAQDDVDTYGNTYTITYELNGGIADPNSPSTYVSGTVTDLGCPTNENKDVAFFGWYLDKECTKNLLYIPSKMNGNLTLYALWDDGYEGHGYKLDTYTKRTETIFGNMAYRYESFGTYSQIFLAFENDDKYLYREIRETKLSSGQSNVTSTVKWNTDKDDDDKDEYDQSDEEVVTLDLNGWNVTAKCITLTLKDNSAVSHVEKQYYIYDWLLIMVDSNYSSGNVVVNSIYQIDSILSEDIKNEYSIKVYSGDGIDVTGAGTYNIGSPAEFTATGDDFLGWYDEAGNLLSTDNTYKIEKVLSDQSLYAYNSKICDITEDCGNSLTVTAEDVENVTWTLRDSSNNIVNESEGERYSYTFETVGKYTLTYSGDKNEKFFGKILTIIADGVDNKTFDWSYGGKDYSITLGIRYSDYYTYKTDDIIRSQGTTEHDKMFVTSDDKYVKQIAEYISGATVGLDKAEVVNVLLRFTQTIPYMYDSESVGQEEYWKYPLETLYDGNGDCEDTSILFCAVGKAMGYDTALMLFSGHATGAISIADMGYDTSDVKLKTERVGAGFFSRVVSYYTIDNSDISTYVYRENIPTTPSYYLYCETTTIDDGKGNEFRVGDVPSYTGRAYYDAYSCYNVLKVIPC